MGAQFDLVAADDQAVTVWLAAPSGPATIYEDAACTAPVSEATVSAYQGTETSRTFYVAAPGVYTLTVADRGVVIATSSVTLSSAQTVCGPYRSAPPASNVIDGTIETIKLRRGTAAAWTAANPVLSSGEPGYESDTDKLKIGDGVTAWNSLPYGPAIAVAADVPTVAAGQTGPLSATDPTTTNTRTPTAGSVVDASVAGGAAIAKSKLAALAIVDADVSAISESKITGLVSDLAGKVAASTTDGPPATNGQPVGTISVDSLGRMWRVAVSGTPDTYAPAFVGPAVTPTAAQTATDGAATSEVADWVFTNVQGWLGWLAQYASGNGFVTEFGIPSGRNPDSLYWAEIADHWLSLMDDAGIGVSQWVAGGMHNASGIMKGLTDASGLGDTDTVDLTVMPLLRHRNGGVRSFGLGVVAGATPPTGFCVANPIGQVLPSYNTLAFVAGLGIKTFRLQFRWELIQPTRSAALSSAYLASLQQIVTWAGQLGIKVILDVHNYASFIDGTAQSPTAHHLGDGNLTQAQLVDLWTRLSTAFVGNANVYAYEIMNEPTGMPGGNYATTTSGTGTLSNGVSIPVADATFGGHTTVNQVIPVQLVASGGTVQLVCTVTDATHLTVTDANAPGSTYGQTWLASAAVTSPALSWQDASQAVVAAIRGNSDTTLLLVSGYDFQAASRWTFNHPGGSWITDSASNFLYTAHNYWSTSAVGGGDAGYSLTWAQEVSNAQSFGYLRLPGKYPAFSGDWAQISALAGGETVLDRRYCSTQSPQLSDGVPFGTLFKAKKNETINYVTLHTDSQACAGASMTYLGVAIYEVLPSKNYKLVAQSANLVSAGAPTAFTATFTDYKVALSAPFYKRAGKVYMVTVLSKGATNAPNFTGSNHATSIGVWPYPSRLLSGANSSFPSYVASSSTSAPGGVFNAYMSPA